VEVRPDVFCIWTEGEGVEVKIGSFLVETLEGMGDADVDPNSDVVGSDIKCSVVELDGFIGPA